MDIFNISKINLDSSLIVDKDTNSTREVVSEFNSGNYDFILVKNYLLNEEFRFFEERNLTMSVYVDFILSKKRTYPKADLEFTFTQFMSILSYDKEKSIVDDTKIDNLNSKIESSIENVLDLLHYDDNGLIVSKLDENTCISIDLGFTIKINAQDDEDSFGRTSNKFYIEKVVFTF